MGDKRLKELRDRARSMIGRGAINTAVGVESTPLVTHYALAEDGETLVLHWSGRTITNLMLTREQVAATIAELTKAIDTMGGGPLQTAPSTQ